MEFHKGVLQLNSAIYASLIFICQVCWNRLFGRCCAIQEREAETYQLSQYDLGISSSLGVVKGIIALFQLYSVVSYITTEKHEKKRINDYGAYQLTLIPYGLMSIVNILCGMVTPTYSAIYMVNSTVMKEAHARGWTFDGTVGELCEDTVGKEGCVRFEATFEGDPGFGLSNGGEVNAQLEVKNDQTREIGTTSSPEVGGREISETGLNTGSRGEIKVRCSSIYSSPPPAPTRRILRATFRREFIRMFCRVFFIRCLMLKDQDPGKGDIKFLLHLRAGQVAEGATQIVIPPIGNPTYRKRSWWYLPMLVVSDLTVLVSLALPYVIIWKLTKFAAPVGSKRQGGIFLLWLVLGQVAPGLWRFIWRDIHSSQTKYWYIRYTPYPLAVAAYSIPAIMGFILVGKDKYRHPDGVPRG